MEAHNWRDQNPSGECVATRVSKYYLQRLKIFDVSYYFGTPFIHIMNCINLVELGELFCNIFNYFR